VFINDNQLPVVLKVVWSLKRDYNNGKQRKAIAPMSQLKMGWRVKCDSFALHAHRK
jgi:hypothetical protein